MKKVKTAETLEHRSLALKQALTDRWVIDDDKGFVKKHMKLDLRKTNNLDLAPIQGKGGTVSAMISKRL